MNSKKGLKKHTEKLTDNYSIGSREKLKSAMRHKLKKTFVGALEIIENELTSSGKSEDLARFKRIRGKILGTGNDQIRNMEAELDKYNVEFIAYHIDLPAMTPQEWERIKNEG